MTTTITPTAARVSGTIKANAARLADQAETLAAPLVGQHEALRSHHLETAAALRILAAIQPDPEPVLLDETSLRARIGDIGNQIHNLACRHQNDEDLSVNLGELSSQLWALARIAPATPSIADALNIGNTDSHSPSSAGMVSVEAAARVLLAKCPNPIFDQLKPVLMGEVTERAGYTDKDGNEYYYDRHVSWDAMKTIIRAALRALTGENS